jgi:hypothetical protein
LNHEGQKEHGKSIRFHEPVLERRLHAQARRSRGSFVCFVVKAFAVPADRTDRP